MSNQKPSNPKPAVSSDPLAASRVGVAAAAAADPEPSAEPEATTIAVEPDAPPPAVKREVRRFKVLERIMVSAGASTITLHPGKVLNTVLYSPEFFEKCRRAGAKLEELPPE